MDIWHVLLLLFIGIQYIKNEWYESEIHNRGFDIGYQIGLRNACLLKLTEKK